MNKLLTAAAFLSGFCAHLQAQTFNGGTGSILDNQTLELPITVSGLVPSTIDTVNFGLEQVCIDLTHTWDADLTLTIIAPDGTSAILASGVGGDGNDFTNTCFRWDAATGIGSGSAPFTGTFKPSGQMGLVNNGQTGNGTWKIAVTDNAGGDEGTVLSCSITFGSSPATYFAFTASDLPIVLINTNGQGISDDPKVMADMGIVYNGPGQRNHTIDPMNAYNGKIGIEVRGNYSASLPQKPYGFELWDVNGNAIEASLLGMPSESDWVLLACYNDKSFARNVLPFHLFDSMGHYAVRTRLVDVVLNDEYQGIYLLGEQIKRDSNRVDVPKLEPTEITGVDVTGGYMLKIDYWDNSNSWQLEHSPVGFPGLDVHMVYYYPKAEDIVPQQQTYIQNFIGLFEDALYGPEFDDPVNGYRQYISTSTFVDYLLISELTRNVDGYKKSHFFYKNKDHADGTYRKLKSGPVWDFDWALKDIDWGSEDGSGLMYEYPAQDVNATGWEIRLLQDTTFANEMRCRYDDLRRTIFSEAYMYAKIDSVAALVAESQAWHFEVWGCLGQATGTPEVQAPSQTYAEEVQRLKDWLHRRVTWLDANLPGTLNGCSMAGLNTLSASNIVAYPNPFAGTLMIEWPTGDLAGCTLRLRDETGRLFREVVIDGSMMLGNTMSISQLEDLSQGVYFVELVRGTETRVLKVLK
jgi:subtilisin-like proprotein convertase family protein